MIYPNGSESVLSPGPFSQLWAVKHCPCVDGVARRARITGQPDTFFSVPAQVKVKGVTVTGFVTSDENGYRFIAHKYRKNGHLLPGV